MICTIGCLPSCSHSYDTIATFSVLLITLIWETTTPDRNLRRLVLDYYLSTVLVEDVRVRVDEFHPEFIKDLLLLSLSVYEEEKEQLDPCQREEAYYHDHDE